MRMSDPSSPAMIAITTFAATREEEALGIISGKGRSGFGGQFPVAIPEDDLIVVVTETEFLARRDEFGLMAQHFDLMAAGLEPELAAVAALE